MLRVKLDGASSAVKKFVSTLPVDPEGVELELNGVVVCEVIGPRPPSDSERDAILQDGLNLISRARRNKAVSGKVIDREIRDAVNEVRRRGKR